MKWGEKFKVETPTFEPNSDLTLDYHGYHDGAALFYLIKFPGILMGKIKIPMKESPTEFIEENE